MKPYLIIADDDPGIQDVFQLIFERAGYTISIYSNGGQLLNGDFEVPDAFILDNQLSGVAGIDICRFLKSQDRTRRVPVIMLSANPRIGSIAIDAGADDYLEKPFKINELLTLINKYVKKDEVVQ